MFKFFQKFFESKKEVKQELALPEPTIICYRRNEINVSLKLSDIDFVSITYVKENLNQLGATPYYCLQNRENFLKINPSEIWAAIPPEIRKSNRYILDKETEKLYDLANICREISRHEELSIWYYPYRLWIEKNFGIIVKDHPGLNYYYLLE